MPSDENDRRALTELMYDIVAGKPLREPALSAKPTPGPWIVGGHPGDNSGANWREVLSDNDRPYGDGALICQAQEADAKLIAAAPSLLAALTGLFEHCLVASKHYGAPCSQMDAGAAIAAARAAIASATA